MTRHVYLDHNATSPLASAAADVIRPYLDAGAANPSSIHQRGQAMRAAIDAAREEIAVELGARSSEICFNSGATESINAAIRGMVASRGSRRRIVTSAVEHPATLDIADRLEREGFEIVRLPVRGDGTMDVDRVADALSEDVALLSLIWVNNETGVFFDIEAIGQAAAAHGVPFHVDAVQYAGKGLERVGEMPIDLLSLSGHKFGAPKGVGLIYIRRGSPIRPFLWGGHHERGRRGGTENLLGIVGMAAALGAAGTAWRSGGRKSVGARRDELERRVLEGVPTTVVAGAGAPRLENTTNLCFQDIEGAAVVLTLSQHGIDASPGSACTAGQAGPSHVIEALDIPRSHVHGAVRFSLSTATTDDEIAFAGEQIVAAVNHVARVNTS